MEAIQQSWTGWSLWVHSNSEQSVILSNLSPPDGHELPLECHCPALAFLEMTWAPHMFSNSVRPRERDNFFTLGIYPQVIQHWQYCTPLGGAWCYLDGPEKGNTSLTWPATQWHHSQATEAALHSCSSHFSAFPLQSQVLLLLNVPLKSRDNKGHQVNSPLSSNWQ